MRTRCKRLHHALLFVSLLFFNLFVQLQYNKQQHLIKKNKDFVQKLQKQRENKLRQN